MTDQKTEDKQEALTRLGRVDVYKVDHELASKYAALLTGPVKLGGVYYSAPHKTETKSDK